MPEKQRGLTYCRKGIAPIARKPRTSPKWCGCGYKIRGKNHSEGKHHDVKKSDVR